MVPRQPGGSAVSSASQRQTTSSTSVSAGADCQLIPSAPRPEEARSPSTEASEALEGGGGGAGGGATRGPHADTTDTRRQKDSRRIQGNPTIIVRLLFNPFIH